MERSTVTSGVGTAADRTAADAASAIEALSETDLARLKALAQLWSRGLPEGFGWADVLHEAIVRVLDGSRVWPFGVPILAFLSGVMRSICDDYWRASAMSNGCSSAATTRGSAARQPIRLTRCRTPSGWRSRSQAWPKSSGYSRGMRLLSRSSTEWPTALRPRTSAAPMIFPPSTMTPRGGACGACCCVINGAGASCDTLAPPP
jgi:hypothetical protein